MEPDLFENTSPEDEVAEEHRHVSEETTAEARQSPDVNTAICGGYVVDEEVDLLIQGIRALYITEACDWTMSNGMVNGGAVHRDYPPNPFDPANLLAQDGRYTIPECEDIPHLQHTQLGAGQTAQEFGANYVMNGAHHHALEEVGTQDKCLPVSSDLTANDMGEFGGCDGGLTVGSGRVTTDANGVYTWEDASPEEHLPTDGYYEQDSGQVSCYRF